MQACYHKPFFILCLLIMLITTGAAKLIENYPAATVQPNAHIRTDSLKGDWELTKIICVKGTDTVTTQPTAQPRGLTTDPPLTTIHFDSLQTFTIHQFCMKCPYLMWMGRYTIETKLYNGVTYPYLHFSDRRDKYLKKKQPSFTAAFNGFVTGFKNDTLQLTDDKNCSWIYTRTVKK